MCLTLLQSQNNSDAFFQFIFFLIFFGHVNNFPGHMSLTSCCSSCTVGQDKDEKMKKKKKVKMKYNAGDYPWI